MTRTTKLTLVFFVCVLTSLSGCLRIAVNSLKLEPSPLFYNTAAWARVTASYVHVKASKDSSSSTIAYLRKDDVVEILMREYGPNAQGQTRLYCKIRKTEAKGQAASDNTIEEGWVEASTLAFFAEKGQR